MNVLFARERVPVGIENSGNTCYCNVVLQILFAAKKFCLWFLQADTRRLYSNPRSRFNGRLCLAWVKLLRQAYACNPDERSPRSLNCSSLLTILRAEHPQFELNRQNDAHEFLRNFLDGLSSDCNRVVKPRPRENLDDRPGERIHDSSERFWQASLGDEQSIVTDMFAGQQATRITCGTCKSVRHRFDPFLDLSVEFDDRERYSYDTLESMIRKSYVGDIEYRELDCPFCKRRCEAEVRQLLWRLPAEYLVIHIKRFRWNSNLGTLSRINNFLELPQDGTLNMALYCPFSSHSSIDNSTFVLEGIVSQSGTVDSGHYTAAAVVGRQWCHFSDETTQGIRQLPDGRSIYLLLFRRAHSYRAPCGVLSSVFPYFGASAFTRDSGFATWPRMLERGRAPSVLRQESANYRARHAWASLTRHVRRNISPSKRQEQRPSESSSASESNAGTSAKGSPATPYRAPNGREAARLISSPAAGMRYGDITHGSVFREQRPEHPNHKGAPNRYARAANVCARPPHGKLGTTRNTANFRSQTPAANLQERRQSSDVSLDMSRLCLDRRECTTGHRLGNRIRSPSPWRRKDSDSDGRVPSCRPPVRLPETEVYASPCFTRHYRQPPPPPEITMEISQRSLRASGGFTDFNPCSSSMRRSVVDSPSREIIRPVPIHPMPVRRQNAYQWRLDAASFLNQVNRVDQRQDIGTREREQRRRTSHRSGRSPSSRRFT